MIRKPYRRGSNDWGRHKNEGLNARAKPPPVAVHLTPMEVLASIHDWERNSNKCFAYASEESRIRERPWWKLATKLSVIYQQFGRLTKEEKRGKVALGYRRAALIAAAQPLQIRLRNLLCEQSEYFRRTSFPDDSVTDEEFKEAFNELVVSGKLDRCIELWRAVPEPAKTASEKRAPGKRAPGERAPTFGEYVRKAIARIILRLRKPTRFLAGPHPPDSPVNPEGDRVEVLAHVVHEEAKEILEADPIFDKFPHERAFLLERYIKGTPIDEFGAIDEAFIFMKHRGKQVSSEIRCELMHLLEGSKVLDEFLVVAEMHHSEGKRRKTLSKSLAEAARTGCFSLRAELINNFICIFESRAAESLCLPWTPDHREAAVCC